MKRFFLLTRIFICTTLATSVFAEQYHIDIPESELELLVYPMTQAELSDEAIKWQKALKEKATEVVNIEIAIKNQTEILNAEDTKASLEEKIERKKADEVEQLTALRLEQKAISDRFELILKEWEKKGGDITAMDQYRSALLGVHVDVKDTSGTWLYVTRWLQSEEGGIYWVKKFFRLLFLLLLFYGFYKLVSRITDAALQRSKISYLMTTFLEKMVRRFMVAIGFLIALTALEFNIGPVLAVIGAAGLVVGLALQNTLSNFASGLLILIYRPFDLEDYVEVGSAAGVVTEMTLLSTRIKTRDNKILTIPNNAVWEGTITNYTESKVRRVDMVFGISYRDDFEKAKKIINNILDKHEDVLDTPAPIVRVSELSESSVKITCYPWVKTKNYWPVFWDVHEQVKTAFDQQGISIPFPQRDVHIIQHQQPSDT